MEAGMTKRALWLVFLTACGRQALVDEVDAKCTTWIETTNGCLSELDELGDGGTEMLDVNDHCDPMVEAAQTATTEELEQAIQLLDCQIEAYETDCTTVEGGEEAVALAQACLDEAGAY
jgi:hypothetical protein